MSHSYMNWSLTVRRPTAAEIPLYGSVINLSPGIMWQQILRATTGFLWCTLEFSAGNTLSLRRGWTHCRYSGCACTVPRDWCLTLNSEILLLQTAMKLVQGMAWLPWLQTRFLPDSWEIFELVAYGPYGTFFLIVYSRLHTHAERGGGYFVFVWRVIKMRKLSLLFVLHIF